MTNLLPHLLPHLLALTPTTNPAVWFPEGTPDHPHGIHSLIRAAILFPGLLILGFLILFLVRALLRRFHLKSAFIVTTVAVSLYVAAFAYRADQFLVTDEPVVYWINRITAALLLFVFLRLLDRLIVVPLLTRGGRLPLSRFVHQISMIVLTLFAILTYGSIAFGWNIDRFLAGSAVVSIVLGLALQETLGNFFSGLVMQASPPFTLGNWIVCGTHEGRVVDMTWRAVTIHTEDDNFILIPNATVAKAEIINYHAPSTATARTIKVGLDYAIPPHDAIPVLETAACDSKGVQVTPPPEARLEQFADSAIVYSIKFWINDPRQHTEIEHAVRVSVWYRLKEKGYGIPFPIRTVEHINLDKKNRHAADAAVALRLRAFERVPLLQPLTQEQKQQLAASANDIQLAPGQILFRQNDPGDSFYIIAQGSVDVLLNDPKNPAAPANMVASLSAGDFFGEMSALTGQPRSATIRAGAGEGHLSAIRIEKDDLLEIFRQDPAIMEKISTLVAQRSAQLGAVHSELAQASASETAATQQKSLLSRMRRFFHLGNPEHN